MKKVHRLQARRYRLREMKAGRYRYFRESEAAISRDQCGHTRATCRRQAVTVEIYACDMHGSQLVEILGHEE
jgi:hypothetical protein